LKSLGGWKAIRLEGGKAGKPQLNSLLPDEINAKKISLGRLHFIATQVKYTLSFIQNDINLCAP